MKRRQFLGFLGGAAAAGPKLATGLAHEAARSSDSIGYAAGPVSAGRAYDDSNWKANRIKQIRDWLKGGDPKDAENKRLNRLYQAEASERFRLDGLRSVSPQHRFRMLVDGNQERNDRIQRIHMERELEELLTPKLPI